MISIKNPIFVTQGDIAGIGWQLFLKIFINPTAYLSQKQIKELYRFIVVGDLIKEEIPTIKKIFNIISLEDYQKNINISNYNSLKPIFLKINDAQSTLGKPSIKNAEQSYLFIKEALKLWKSNLESSLITLPVSKEWIMKAGIKFVGHTEMLQSLWKIPTFMCMYHHELSILLLTNHIPISKVSIKLKKTNFEALKHTLIFFNQLFTSKKPIGFLGLNPHAGEGGKIGNEEFYLQEKINHLNKNLLIDSLLPADSTFTANIRKKYSLIIANYHDQGLIPFKTLYGTEGINISLNLPQLRVSPDHGPAYSLAAGKNIKNADINSILNSIKFAIDWSQKWNKLYSYLS